MKKIFSIALSIMIILALVSCSDRGTEESSSQPETTPQAEAEINSSSSENEEPQIQTEKTYLSNDVYVDDLSDSKNMGLITHKEGAMQGYTLFTPRHYNSSYLVDMNGELVHEWTSEYRVEHAELLDNGLLLRSVQRVTDLYAGLPMIHERLEMVNENNEIVWKFDYVSDDYVMRHDFIMLPNGNILASVYNVISRSEAVQNGRDGATIRNDILVDGLIEIKPNFEDGGGEIVWEWNMFDHIVQNSNSTKDNYGEPSENKQLFDFNFFRETGRDWTHFSGIDYNEELDLIVISAHINDEIIIIDHSTTTEEARGSTGGNYGIGGDILYRFGNPAAYGEGVFKDKNFYALHDPQWISNTEIMVLNNNFSEKNSEIQIITLPDELTPENANIGTVGVVYNDFHTRNMGGAEYLENGNLLVFESVKGTIKEATPTDEVVWKYLSPVANEGVMTQGQEIQSNPSSNDLHNEYYLAYIFWYNGCSGDYLGNLQITRMADI